MFAKKDKTEAARACVFYEPKEVVWPIALEYFKKINWIKGEKAFAQADKSLRIKTADGAFAAEIKDHIPNEILEIIVKRPNVGEQLFLFQFIEDGKKRCIMNLKTKVVLFTNSRPGNSKYRAVKRSFKAFAKDMETFIRDTLQTRGLSAWF